MRTRPNPLTVVAYILVIVGAINWGLVGLLEVDLVAALFGDMSLLSRIIYTLVGLAGVYLAVAKLAGRKHHDETTTAHRSTTTHR